MGWLNALGGLVSGWFDLKKTKMKAEGARYQQLAQAEADWDTEALRQSQFSWKDEAITYVWLSPFIVAWFDEDRAMAWVRFVQELPLFYWTVMFGIVAASFGLRWYFKQQNLKVTEIMKK